ncbi:MAG: SH3 domain-containing protein [Bacilli bacterium]|nr:SH3 domain-containing protein [Bacilli bacterium]
MIVNVKTSNNGTLNLRQSASATGKILAQIPNGTKLDVETVDNTWSKTTFSGKTGYVMTKFLSTTTTSTISKEDLQRIYNSLKSALTTIESILK